MISTLVVLAAGRGSRFGGAKQFEPIGPRGQPLLDYAVYDAVQAGFGRVVFVVAPAALQDFGQHAAARYGRRVAVACVAQRLEDLPRGFVLPRGRTRPWGTLHAVWAARAHVQGPFAVINADDYYGPTAFRRLAEFFREPAPPQPPPAHCLVAYALRNTLSGHGGVNRGICTAHDGLLQAVEEHTDIVETAPGRCEGRNAAGQRAPLDGDAWASMNVWGFRPPVWEAMASYFAAFLRGDPGTEAECYLPDFVDAEVRGGRAHCRLLRTGDSWCGITYREDRAACVQAIAARTAAGEYPVALWNAG